MKAGFVLIFCWSLFFLYWAVMAPSVKKSKETQGAKGILWHQTQMFFQFLLLFGIIPFRPFNLVIWPRSAATDMGGVFLCLAGAAVSIWSRRTLGGNWSSSVTFKQNHQLIVKGPYQFVRHPIYTGILLLMLGTALTLGRLDSILGFLLRCLSYFFKIKREENLLLKKFPKDYPRYRARINALFPFPGFKKEKKS